MALRTMYCTYCGAELTPRLSLPGKCGRCKHDFEWKPAWVPNVIVLVSLLPPPLLGGALRHVGLAPMLGGFAGGFALTFVLFNLLEVAAWKVGLLRSDHLSEEPVPERVHVKKPLSELDYLTRARVELSRLEVPDVRGGQGMTHLPDQASGTSKAHRKRCRFEHVRPGQAEKIEYLSRLATQIVREHFDPIIGKEQNDYMLARFQTPEAIARQLDEGYEYCFVCPPGTTGSEPPEQRRIGFVAFRPEGTDELCLSKFYLRSDQRGRGYSHDMLEFVRREASRHDCSRITLNVNRNNFQAILAYEHLGFQKVGESRRDIGQGFVMDDLVYELSLG